MARAFARRLLWLLVLPLAVYALAYGVVDRVRPAGLQFATIPMADFADVAAAEALHRYFWLSAFLMLTAVSLAVAASAAMALARQRTYLQQASLVYIFAVLAMLSWMYWPLPFLASEAVRADCKGVVMGAAVLQGVTFTLGIAAIYLPPALLLRRRAEAAAASRDAARPADPETRAALAALAPHPLDQFRQAVAMVTPALMGLLPVLNEVLGLSIA